MSARKKATQTILFSRPRRLKAQPSVDASCALQRDEKDDPEHESHAERHDQFGNHDLPLF